MENHVVMGFKVDELVERPLLNPHWILIGYCEKKTNYQMNLLSLECYETGNIGSIFVENILIIW
jgi:hypothetical protein